MAGTRAGAGDAPAELFRGYDGIARGTLNESAVTGGSEPGDGGRTAVNIRVCESVSELAQALEIDASLSVSYLKALNVTAKMNFMKKVNATARSITIVVYACHETGTWTASHVKLADGIAAPANDDEAADFVAAYGDSYVSAATHGAEYYAVYTFRTETQSEQKDLTASLKAKGVYSGVTAKADVQVKLSDFLKTTSTNWTFDQEITGHKNPAPPDQDKMIEFALAFSKTEPDAPKITGVKVSGYEGVPGMGRRKFAKIVQNRDHFLGDEGVLQSFAHLTGIQNQITWLKRVYRRYNYTGDAALLGFETQVKSDLAAINKQVTAYKSDPAADVEKPPLPSLAQGEPVLSYAVGQTPSFGGEGAGPFDFMPVGEALRNQVKIASIRLWEGAGGNGGMIHKLDVGYASDKSRWTTSHGANGTGRELLILEEGHFPVRFKINCGSYVDRVEIHLSDGRSTWAGGSGGALVDWKVPDGSVVLGFAGRAGLLLDQLKIVHVALKPAEYRTPLR
jgi:hypothetical protein